MWLWCKRIFWTGFVVGLIGLGVLLYANYTILKFAPRIISADKAPTSSLALIFGGGMKNPTDMSEMQWDRVEVGAQLYNRGRVAKLMITGDDGALRADEITAMTKRLVELGVPTSSLLIDPHGYRTYESCIREARIYGVTSTIVISQSFHLPRIQYFCEHFGISTTPVHADLRVYEHSLWSANIREWLARLKGWWQISLTKPEAMTWER